MPLLILNKPFRVLSQFTDDSNRPTLADFIDRPGVYPAGRLDFDSEGLLLLTDDGRLQAAIADAASRVQKRYWAQVEGAASADALGALREGVRLKDGIATALDAREMAEPQGLWDRHPPIRYRKSVADTWLDIAIDEGRNRQVRRMTAAVGLPTLRLIRYRVGPWTLDGLGPGEFREETTAEAWQRLRAARS